MRRSTMLAATALTIGLATSATPAMATTGHSATPSRTQVAQGHDHGRDGDFRHHRGHHWRHHWRGFVVGGAIKSIDTADGEITIDPRRGPDRTFAIEDFTRITRDGDRAAVNDLAVGDRAFVRAVAKHGVLWAVRVDALS